MSTNLLPWPPSVRFPRPSVFVSESENLSNGLGGHLKAPWTPGDVDRSLPPSPPLPPVQDWVPTYRVSLRPSLYTETDRLRRPRVLSQFRLVVTSNPASGRRPGFKSSTSPLTFWVTVCRFPSGVVSQIPCCRYSDPKWTSTTKIPIRG